MNFTSPETKVNVLPDTEDNMGAGQVVPKTSRTLPTRTQVNSYPIPTRTQDNSYPIPSRTQKGQKRLGLGATPSVMLYPLIFDFSKCLAIV